MPAFYPMIPFSCLDTRTYNDLTDSSDDTTIKYLIDPIPMMDIFNKMRWHVDNLYGKQKRWHTVDGIELLDFSNFASEVKRIGPEFGVTFDPDQQFTVENASIYVPGKDDFTPTELDVLRSYYQDDYDFLASKGITFS